MLIIKLLLWLWLVSGLGTAFAGLLWVRKKSAEMLHAGEE
jgi:hypothetical protein